MIVFIMEKTINSLLSALFFSFTKKIKPQRISDGKIYIQAIGDIPYKIINNLSANHRVEKALIGYAGCEIISKLKICLMSCDENASLIAFNFAYLILENRKNITDDLSKMEVSDFIFTEQKVMTERHHIIGFLRFTESENGVIYAKYSPDNDITELIASHFIKRLSGIPFIIHDIKRNKIAISDGSNIKIDYTELIATFKPSENEINIYKLWKKYYNTVNIKERKNIKQQNSYMPVRYRKYMPETYETD